MKGLKPYQKYKDSGIEWLDKIPSIWDMKRLKMAVNHSAKKNLNDDDLPYIGLENIESWTGRLIESENEKDSESLNSLFKTGDVLLGKLRPYLAKALVADFDGQCTSELLVLRPKDLKRDFLFYLILSDQIIKLIDSSTYGAKMPRANWDFIGNIYSPIPSVDEQKAITSFLDGETARIDSLIDKKQRLIELLKERRTALITQAVTKGLDPKVPMKESCVEWLGEIPRHWEVRRLKLAVAHSNRKNLNDDDLPYLGLENIESWTGRFIESVNENDSESLNSMFEPGDVLLGKLRPYLAKVLIVNFDGQCTSELLVLKPKVLKKDYLFYLLLSDRVINLIDSSTYGAKMPRANWDFIGNIRFPIPSPDEQRLIVSFIDRETVRIDSISAKTTESIEKLKEYRSALISAAVTGKVDVRSVSK
jgi:type I restriction enzyme S subunit